MLKHPAEGRSADRPSDETPQGRTLDRSFATFPRF
jgi:hypothetical protein